jgi:hypothetical protein
MAGAIPAMLPAAATLPAMAPRIDLLECLADVFVGGVLYTRVAWGMGLSSLLGVRAGAEADTSPRLAFTVLHFMAKSNKVVPKKGRGRPATGRNPVTAIRLSMELRETVDKWAGKQDDQPGRSEAIRRLVEIGLRAKK